jgi:hypothetical protein
MIALNRCAGIGRAKMPDWVLHTIALIAFGIGAGLMLLG